ncbi:hypothetical protein PMO01_15480 [Pseudomonas moraviensis R28-S]|uniref:Uncharacterized protein n=1 Tax=Pseudomonas moraviensis R28-S TaxID=1395516 RepID=V8R957_9PSED|nr:hypothetical protein PMO01_15480 [Pseudomonas moraviensis R28-S]
MHGQRRFVGPARRPCDRLEPQARRLPTRRRRHHRRRRQGNSRGLPHR